MQRLLQELQINGFTKNYHLDTDSCIDRLFYVHLSNISLLQENPDIILLVCTYSTNRFKIPMLHIEAVTSHNLTISVGVCFLRYERRVD